MMQGRRVLVGLLLGVVVLAGPASAHEFVGHEEDEQTLACPAPGEELPPSQEPPGHGECDEPEETHYQGKVWDNDVTCAEGGTDVAGLQVYTVVVGWPHNEYSAGVCNDGRSAAPVQGRFVAQGWQLEEYSVYADGDRDNSPEVAQGWVRLDGSTNGARVRCGDDTGRKDATHAQAGLDTQEDCG